MTPRRIASIAARAVADRLRGARPEVAAEACAAAGSEVGAGAGSEVGAGAGSEVGAGAGSELGAGAGAGSEVGAGAGMGAAEAIWSRRSMSYLTDRTKSPGVRSGDSSRTLSSLTPRAQR